MALHRSTRRDTGGHGDGEHGAYALPVGPIARDRPLRAANDNRVRRAWAGLIGIAVGAALVLAYLLLGMAGD